MGPGQGSGSAGWAAARRLRAFARSLFRRPPPHPSPPLRPPSSLSLSSQTELLLASKERDARLSESKQFLQLRGLMQKKNAQLAELRARLSRYEPDDSTVGKADDD